MREIGKATSKVNEQKEAQHAGDSKEGIISWISSHGVQEYQLSIAEFLFFMIGRSVPDGFCVI